MSLTLHGVTDELTPEYLRYADALKTAGDAFHDAEKLFTDKRKGWEKVYLSFVKPSKCWWNSGYDNLERRNGILPHDG